MGYFGYARIHSPSLINFLLLVVELEMPYQSTNVADIAAP